jgi:Glycogen recognition site of AMP-activated protein kinase
MKRTWVLVGFVLILSFHAQQTKVCIAQTQSTPPAASQVKPGNKPSPKINPEILKKYAGRYTLEVGIIPISTLDVTLENDVLWVKPSLVKKRKLIPQSKSLFLDEVEGTKYKFNRDADGNYTTLTFEYEGSSYTAERVVLPPPSLKGNTTFRLKGYKDASVVTLAGSFNNWNQSQLVCGHENDEWVCRVDLEPGYYTYKFIVDGNWVLDPDNPNTALDDAGNTNNVLNKP